MAFNAAIIGAGNEMVEVEEDVAVPPTLTTLVELSSSMGTLPATMRINSNNDFIRSIISLLLPPAAPASSVLFFAFFFLSDISAVELLMAGGEGDDDDMMTKGDTSTPREVSSHSSRRGKADDRDEEVVVVVVVVVVVDDDDDKFAMASRREGKIVLSLIAVRGVAETELIVSMVFGWSFVVVGTGEVREAWKNVGIWLLTLFGGRSRIRLFNVLLIISIESGGK